MTRAKQILFSSLTILSVQGVAIAVYAQEDTPVERAQRDQQQLEQQLAQQRGPAHDRNRND